MNCPGASSERSTCDSAAKLTMTSTSLIKVSTSSMSQMSPCTNRNDGMSATGSRLCTLPAYVSLSSTITESSGCRATVCLTNSLPMNPAPPGTSSLMRLSPGACASDVLDAPVEADARIIPRDPALVRVGGVVGLGHVVHEMHVVQAETLVPVSDKRRNGHNTRAVLAEDQGLDRAGGGGGGMKVYQHHAGVADDDVPVVPLLLVPVECLDQLRWVAAACIHEASRHLRKGALSDERTAVVIDVSALELLDEKAPLVSVLHEGLDLDVVDAACALRGRGETHAFQRCLDLRRGRHPGHQRSSTRLWSPTISLMVRGRSGGRPRRRSRCSPGRCCARSLHCARCSHSRSTCRGRCRRRRSPCSHR